ncbi:hypothetical protein QAD02_013759 [Eretmocerus hayati]|uniref:Uncharacterized protein n=1 Tax=Eretmocerus hayati TaxID=131215 RepID=A0ACC2P3P1_9HYME|nr:hypothetical protein QAD02_013759 [Eretmocerus hayati]
MPVCSVLGCKKRSKSVGIDGTEHFFRFPKGPITAKEWSKFCGRDVSNLEDHTSIVDIDSLVIHESNQRVSLEDGLQFVNKHGIAADHSYVKSNVQMPNVTSCTSSPNSESTNLPISNPISVSYVLSKDFQYEVAMTKRSPIMVNVVDVDLIRLVPYNADDLGNCNDDAMDAHDTTAIVPSSTELTSPCMNDYC